jgi:hypothetical protein
MDVVNVSREFVDWIPVLQDRDRRLATVNMAMNLSDPKMLGYPCRDELQVRTAVNMFRYEDKGN